MHVCAYLPKKERERARARASEGAQRHQECLIKVWNGLRVPALQMALELKGRIKREHGQACSHSTLITAEWRDKSGRGGRRKASVGVERQLKCEKVPTFRRGGVQSRPRARVARYIKLLNYDVFDRNQCHANYCIPFAFLLSLFHVSADIFYLISNFFVAFDCDRMLLSPAEQHFGQPLLFYLSSFFSTSCTVGFNLLIQRSKCVNF